METMNWTESTQYAAMNKLEQFELVNKVITLAADSWGTSYELIHQAKIGNVEKEKVALYISNQYRLINFGIKLIKTIPIEDALKIVQLKVQKMISIGELAHEFLYDYHKDAWEELVKYVDDPNLY